MALSITIRAPCVPRVFRMFSSEHSSAPDTIALDPGDVGSRRLADAGMSAAHHEVRGAGEDDQWFTKGADCAHGSVVE